MKNWDKIVQQMHLRIPLYLTLGLLLLASACGSPGAQSGTSQPTVSPSPSEGPAGTPEKTPVAVPAPLQPARSHLAKQLGIPLDQVILKSDQAVQWPDACLGAAGPDELCAQVITPGYKAIFSTPQGDFEVHTNQSGKVFRILQPGSQPTAHPPGESLAVVWERSGGIAGVCQTLTISDTGSFLLENCKGGELPVNGQLPANQMAKLNDLLSRYDQFKYESTQPAGSADMFSDRLTFFGHGTTTPTQQEQASVDQFVASLVTLITATPTPAASTGSSGIEGKVLIGPACPGPVRAGSPCPDQPYQASFTVLDQNNNPVTQFQSDAQGHFKVSLPPGTYILHPELSGAFPRASDQVVTVNKGQFTEITITFDSGMR